MPLNPPTYQSMDVYYSNNVFVNKVPVALWKPPAGAFNDGSPGTSNASGGTMFHNVESGYKAYDRSMSTSMGANLDEDESDGSNANTTVVTPVTAYAQSGAIGTPGYTGPLGPGTGPDPNPSAPAPSSSFELNKNNLPNYSPKYPILSDPLYQMRISQYFKFNSITMSPEESRGYSARQIAANWIDLAVNMLDPIKANGWNFNITSGFRSHNWNISRGRNYLSDHELGIAADIQFFGDRAKNRAMFQWIIKSKLRFWQCIWEGNWIHISYNSGQPMNGDKRILIMPSGTKAGGSFAFGNDIDAAIQKSNSIS